MHTLHQGEITRGAAPSSSIHVNVTAAAIPFSARVYYYILAHQTNKNTYGVPAREEKRL